MGPFYLLAFLGLALARPNIDTTEDRLDLPEERSDLLEGDILPDPDKRNAIYSRLWPNGRIPYTFDPQYESQFTAAEKQRIQEAFNDYAKYTCLRIVPKTSSDTAYINIIRGGGCYSNVGRIGRKQTLSLGRGCTGKGTIIHEFMHASGFHHEQGRTDRDDYIWIKYENIQSGMDTQFKKYSTSEVQDLGAPYDYGSVMHYSAYAFSKNRQATIVPKQQGVTIGNRAGFSQVDIFKLNKLYKCSNKVTLAPYTTLKPGATTKPAPTTKPTTPAPRIVTERFSCNFDSGLCGMVSTASDQFDWTRGTGRTPSANTGPNGDHTSGRGYYMFIEASNPRKPDEKAHIMTPEIRGTSGRVYCFNFWYSMNGTGMGRLNVFTKPAGSTSAKGIFSKIGDQGNQWKNAKVSITYQQPFHLVFEGIVGSNFLSDIAIDDVTFAPGSCGQVVTSPPVTVKPTQTPTTKQTAPPTTQKPVVLKGGFSCNFNGGNCGFTQDTKDKFDWMRRSGATPSGSTGPTTDRSGSGHYFYTEASSPQVQGDIARMYSPVMDTVGSYCLEFYYHMYGSDMGSLAAYQVTGGQQKRVFLQSGDKGNSWMVHRSQITLNGRSQVMFESTRGASFRSDMAIDDVSVTSWPGRCGTPVTQKPVSTQKPVITTRAPTTGLKGDFTCNFDGAMCLVQSKTDKFDWIQQSGSTSSGNTGPTSDHTSGSGKYIYTETSSPRVAGDKASVSTPDLQYTGTKCVSFWVHMWGSTMGSLKVYKNSGSSRQLIYSKTGDMGNRWSYVSITTSFSGISQIEFESTRGSSYLSDMALDDIAIRTGQCQAGVTFAPVTSNPGLKTWECHFETNTCGMRLHAPAGSGYQWMRRSGQTPSSSTGPVTGDNTRKTPNGFYVFAEASSPAVQGDKAWLDTPDFAGQNTCLKFYYHMNGLDIDKLNVYIGYGNSFSSTPAFTATGHGNDAWKEKRISINTSRPFKVRFEAIRGANFRGDIAIDDISISTGCSKVITAPVGK